MMHDAYHVLFGANRQVGRFLAGEGDHPPGTSVVVRSSRGTELGRVVARAGAIEPGPRHPEILRAATPADFDAARRAESDRPSRFEACRSVFADGVWPITPIDIEPLLDPGRAVLTYLGPHHLDADGLREALHEASGLDLVFEPIGRDEVEVEPEPDSEDESGCGSCGSDGGCGSGGCGTGGGCSGCSVASLVGSRGRKPRS